MSTFDKLRKATASKISTVDNVEIFAWDKWIRMPSNESQEIGALFSRLTKTDKIILSIKAPDISDYKIAIAKVKTYKSSQRILSFKSRSNIVFFQFGKTSSFSIPVKFSNELKPLYSAEILYNQGTVVLKINKSNKKETTTQVSPLIRNISFNISNTGGNNSNRNNDSSNIDFEFNSLRSKGIGNSKELLDERTTNFKLDPPLVIDYLSELIPKVYNINLLSTFEGIKSGLDNFLIKIELLDKLPIIQKADLANLSEARLYSLHFKNEINSTIDKKVYIEKLSALNVHLDKSYFPELLNIEDKMLAFKYQNESSQPLVSGKNLSKKTIDIIDHTIQPKLKIVKEAIKPKVPVPKQIEPKINKIISKEVAEPIPIKESVQNQKETNIVKETIDIIEGNEFWIDLDREQRLEYDQELYHAQNQLLDIYKTGNPYRLQAKVFTLIHQLKQILNFSSKAKASKKSALLLSHIASIKNSKSKAIVFSQYDKFGTQRLMDIFTSAEIKYISCLPGVPQNELEVAIKKFENDKPNTILLMAAKAVPPKLLVKNFQFIIHFDQWWTPVTQWQIEDKLINGNKSPIQIINYYNKDTIDENIRNKLNAYGLLNKNIVELIGTDSFSKLLIENDWFDIFKLEADKKNKELNEKLPYSEFIKLPIEAIQEKITPFLINLGYKNISKETEADGSSTIFRSSYVKKGQQSILTAVYLRNNLIQDEQSLIKFIESKNEYKAGKVFIIIPNKDLDITKIKLQDNISIIDSKDLYNYLQVFRVL